VPVRDYARQHPDSAFLVIEVAETSLRKDRLTKRRVYARAGVPEYWIVNLVDKIVEVHTGPGTAGYTTVTQHRHGDTLRPSLFADIDVNLGELLAGLVTPA
jgi:Uma2 family endonuclease